MSDYFPRKQPNLTGYRAVAPKMGGVITWPIAGHVTPPSGRTSFTRPGVISGSAGIAWPTILARPNC